MVTNDDVAYNGKVIKIESHTDMNGIECLSALFVYKDIIYNVIGRMDELNKFHAFWGDDKAEMARI